MIKRYISSLFERVEKLHVITMIYKNQFSSQFQDEEMSPRQGRAAFSGIDRQDGNEM